MAEFFGPLIFILNMTGIMVLIFKEKAGRMIPMVFILSSLFLFPFGFMRQLTEFLWCRMSGGVYRERTLYRALQVFLLSLYLPAFDRLEISKFSKEGRMKNIAGLILAAGFILTAPLVMDSNLIFYTQTESGLSA